MQKVVLVLAMGLLMFSVGGCGSGEETEEVTSTPTPGSSPAETEAEVTEDGADAEEAESQKEDFEDPLVEERQEEQAAAEAGLIQSTKPEERLLQLKGSTNGTDVAVAPRTTPTDPFGVLPPLVVQGTSDDDENAAQSLEVDARQVPELPALPVAAAPPAWTSGVVIANQPPGTTPGSRPSGTSGTQTTAPSGARTATTSGAPSGAKPKPGSPAATTTATTSGAKPKPGSTTTTPPDPSSNLSPAQIPGLPKLPSPPQPPTPPPLAVATVPALPQLPPSEPPQAWLDPNPPQVEEPPPPPSTAIAEAIAVTGVLQAGNKTRVILKAPSEPTSRYVTVGQTIANGEVLVKRVKFSPDTDPIVIFEQNGVEIAIEVGSMPIPEEGVNIITPPPPAINAFNPV